MDDANARLRKVFRIMAFFDKARWEHLENPWKENKKSLINFYKEDLDDDVKLLTHWFCYVSDRQMPYHRIWDIGGFVYSEMVDAFKKEGLNVLNLKQMGSFFEIGQDSAGGFVARSEGNEITRFYENDKKGKPEETTKVVFKPRYYPSDYFSFLATLHFLEEYCDKSFAKFMAEQVKRHQDKDDLVRRLLFSLYRLTYDNIGRRKKSDCECFETNLDFAKERSRKIKELYDSAEFENRFMEFSKISKASSRFKQKRAWCSLRDFFKHPEFKEYLLRALKKEDVSENAIESLFSESNLHQFELPGDVWNNNSKFRHCILGDPKVEKEAWKDKSLNLIQ